MAKLQDLPRRDPPQTSSDRLDSWKEIAAHLNRNVRTVQRWERAEGLPVHRHLHASRGSVYASAAELDRWWRERAAVLDVHDEPSPERQAREERTSFTPHWILVAGIAIVAIAAAAVAAWRTGSPDSGALRAIAVLPFKPIATAEADGRLQLGLTEAVIAQLSHLKSLRVEPLARVRRFDALEQDPLEAGRALRVDAVVEGHFQLSGDKLLVRTRLLRTDDGTALAVNEWDEPFRNILTVKSRVAESLADALGLTLSAADRARLRGSETTSPEAFRHYLYGRYHLEVRNATRIRDAEREFNEALTFDPNYARAHAGLAIALISLAWLDVRPGYEVFAPAKAAAERALAIDDSVALAHTALGYVHDYFEYDPAAAQSEHLRAMALDTRDVWVLRAYASFLMRRDAFDEALAVIDRAIDLDPTAPLSIRHKGMILYVARRYDACVAETRRTLTLDPGDTTIAYPWLGSCLEQQGRQPDAVDAYGRALIARGYQARAERLDRIYRSAGSTAYWREQLPEAADPPALAKIHAHLGNTEAALEQFARGYETRAPWINNANYPEWDALRADPRFQELRRRIGRSDAINEQLAVSRRAVRVRAAE